MAPEIKSFSHHSSEATMARARQPTWLHNPTPPCPHPQAIRLYCVMEGGKFILANGQPDPEESGLRQRAPAPERGELRSMEPRTLEELSGNCGHPQGRREARRKLVFLGSSRLERMTKSNLRYQHQQASAQGLKLPLLRRVSFKKTLLNPRKDRGLGSVLTYWEEKYWKRKAQEDIEKNYKVEEEDLEDKTLSLWERQKKARAEWDSLTEEEQRARFREEVAWPRTVWQQME